MDSQNLTLSLAFVAGLLSFLSPCVLPLVPAYIGYLGGTTVISGERGGTWKETLAVFVHALFFVLGFMLVFVLLGASATLLGRLLLDFSVLLQRVGGVLLVVFGMRLLGIGWNRWRWLVAALIVALLTFVLESGLVSQGAIGLGPYTPIWLAESVMMGLVVLAGADWGTVRQVILAVLAGLLNYFASFDAFVPNFLTSLLISLSVIFLNRADFFYSEKKLELERTGQKGYARSLLFGVVFAAGWTPCVGPILAGILVVASQLQTVAQGILLLVAYSLGLGIPFLIVGLLLGPMSRWLRKANRYLGIVSAVSGGLLVLMGILIFTGSLGFLSQYGSFVDFGM